MDTKFAKSKNAWKVLSTLIYKSITQEKLSCEEAVDLLVLPDMYFGKSEDMELPIKTLMTIIMILMGRVKFSSSDLKEKIFLCEKMVLARFFDGKKLSEMIKMLKTMSKNPDIARKLEEYGPGFDDIYLNGIADGRVDGRLRELLMLNSSMLGDYFLKVLIMRLSLEALVFPYKNLKKLKMNFKTPYLEFYYFSIFVHHSQVIQTSHHQHVFQQIF